MSIEMIILAGDVKPLALALHANATRPFLRPENVATEEVLRRANSTRLLWFVVGTTSRRVRPVGAAASAPSVPTQPSKVPWHG